MLSNLCSYARKYWRKALERGTSGEARTLLNLHDVSIKMNADIVWHLEGCRDALQSHAEKSQEAASQTDEAC